MPALLLVSCTREESACRAGDGLKITLSCGPLTKATQAGIDALNENKLTDAWVFLFPSGALSGNNGSTQSVYQQFVNLKGVNGNAEFTLNPSLEEADGTIFPNNASGCDIFVLVNYRGSETFQTAPTIAQLQSLVLEADFRGADPDPTIGNYKVQDDFVMTGYGTITLDRNTNPISGSCTINLQRLASKIELSVHISQQIVGDDNTVWLPHYDRISVKIYNAKSKGLLGGGIWNPVQRTSLENLTGDALTSAKAANGFFDYYQRNGTATTIDGESRSSVGPFYSYATSWSEPFADESTYAYLEVPFTAQGATGSSYSYYHYRVRLLSGKLEPNKWYTQRVNISLLGALHQGEEIPVIEDNSFTVKDWTAVNTSVTIQDNRYLDVTYSGNVSVTKTSKYNSFFGVEDANKVLPVVMLDNLEDVSVTYASSPSIKLTEVTKYYYDFSGTNAAKVTAANKGAGTVSAISGSGTSASPWTAAFTNGTDSRPVEAYIDKNSIRIHHGLDNRDSDADTKYDVSAFYIKLHIRHEDLDADTQDGTYSDIYIVQKSAISIEMELNKTGDNGSAGYGDVFVNGQNGGGVGSLGTLGTSSASNNNWNMVVISISRLNPQSQYVICDPRVDRENSGNLSELTTNFRDGWSTSPIVSDDKITRKLMYYRKTKTGTDVSSKNQIAPSYRFASSHGATSTNPALSRDDATRRCASYQEAGYPAGRWRLPTEAEVRFAMSLSANKKIDFLFGAKNSSSTYWIASGTATINRSNNDNTVTVSTNDSPDANELYVVRCVYDEWYWKDKCPKNQFTWGDMQ